MIKKVLVTGGLGQLGPDITMRFRENVGASNVILTDLKEFPEKRAAIESGPFQTLNALDGEKIAELVKKNKIDTIVHLAAMLSGACELQPQKAWQTNLGCLYNVLEVARQYNCKVYHCSSIAVFGKNCPNKNVPQDTILQPQGMYGVTKVAGELLADYYYLKYGVDARSVRYPGVIDKQELLGGGTTDYANFMIQAAVKDKKYSCFLKEDTNIDMMYIKDAVNVAWNLMNADSAKLKHRNGFNVTSYVLNPKILVNEIKKHVPDFQLEYQIDETRQKIADSWPDSIDDSAAKQEWGWKPEYDIGKTVDELLQILSKKKNN